MGLVEGKTFAQAATASTLNAVGGAAFDNTTKRIGLKVFDNLPQSITTKIIHESLDNKSIPVAIVKQGFATAKSQFTSRTSKELVDLIKNDVTNKKKIHQPMVNTRVALATLIDYAIIGPDVSSAYDFIRNL